jgi:hypothetical protein
MRESTVPWATSVTARARTVVIAVALFSFCVVTPAAAQEHDVAALAKTSQNPIGDLITLPFQTNFNTGGGLDDQTFLNVNFQPVMPFKVSDGWNVIARTIVPLDSLPGPNGSRFSGVGDIQEQIYLTPAKPGAVIWGVGPMFSFPTSTIGPLQTGSWAAGPGAVVMKIAGPWVVGGVVNWFFTFEDAGDETEFNYFVLQPIVNYNIGRSGWALAFSPIMTQNYDGESGDQWTVPLGLGIVKTTVFNGRPMNIGLHYFSNAASPEAGPGQQLRFLVSFLYPKNKS